MDSLRVVLGPIVSIPVLFSVLTGLVTVVLACVFTRLSTGSRYQQGIADRESKNIKTLPYWIPWLGHTLSFGVGGQAFLVQCSQRGKQIAFGIVLRGKKYVVISSPGLVKQLEDLHAIGPSADAKLYKLRHFFGDRSSGSRSTATLSCYNNDKQILTGVDGMAETQDHISKITKTLERTAYNLISFNESWIDQSSWERTSKTIIHSGSNSSAEVSFFPLIESFVGEIATTALLGKNFLENNPDFLEDMGIWNSKGTSFMKQIPMFLPQMSGAAAARQRVLMSLKRFRNRLSVYIAGSDPGTDWSDLSDVSPFMTKRMEQWRSQSRSPSEQPDISVDAALLWAFNKPNTLIAWLLYRVYSDRALLAAVRKEIQTFIHIQRIVSELPIPEPPRVTIDVEELVRTSVLLRAVMNETLRLDSNGITYGVATKDVVMTESHEDVTNLGKDKADSYIVTQGDLLCLPRLMQRTGQGAGTFNLPGFSSLSNLKAPTATAVAAAEASHVFGVEGATCPGRSLAEQEIMVIAATILSIWEVDGVWTWPEQKLELCSMLPFTEIRVKFSRRRLAV